jgi:membrane-associated phospholipid phosphatase
LFRFAAHDTANTTEGSDTLGFAAPATFTPSILPPITEQSFYSLNNPLFLTGTAATTAGLIHFDQQTYTVLRGWRKRSAILSTLSPDITNLGNGAVSAGLFAGYYGYGALFDNEQTTLTGRIGLESFAVSGAGVQFLKMMFGRQQPSVATVPGGRWQGPFSYFDHDRGPNKGIASFDAFPSGHTTTAFAAATTIADAYDNCWVSCAAYTVASGIGISRVMESQHWLSDCFVGGMIGTFSTRMVERFNSMPSYVQIAPSATRSGYGVSLLLSI